MVQIAGRTVPTSEAVIIGTGAAMVIDLFIPWYRNSDSGMSLSENGFGAGVLATLPALLIIAVAAITAAKVFSGFALPATAKAGPAAILLGLSGLGALLLVLKLLLDANVNVGYDRSVGLVIAVVLAVAQAYFVYMAFKASGEALPDFRNRTGGLPPGT